MNHQHLPFDLWLGARVHGSGAMKRESSDLLVRAADRKRQELCDLIGSMRAAGRYDFQILDAVIHALAPCVVEEEARDPNGLSQFQRGLASAVRDQVVG